MARQVAQDVVRAEIDRLIALGGEIDPTGMVNHKQAFSRFKGGCKNLLRLLGETGDQWSDVFDRRSRLPSGENAIVKEMLGTLEAVKDAVDNNLLLTIEDLVSAELSSNLLEQAEDLLPGGCYVAAGALGRAVLEEHLRSWCDRSGCAPTKPRPTLSDYNAELYREKHINKNDMKHVDAMTGVGNAAAHNEPELEKDDVVRLLRDVRDFVAMHA